MEKYYEKVFSDLLELVEKDREVKTQFYPSYEEAIGNVFNLGGKQFQFYDGLVKVNEIRAAKAIEKIAVKLIENQKLSYFSFHPVPEYYNSLPIPMEEKAKMRPFQLVLNKNGMKKGVVFSLQNDVNDHLRNFRNGEYQVDALVIVIILLPNEEIYRQSIVDFNERNKAQKVNVEKITIKEFWVEHFGEDAFYMLLKYADAFNDSAKDIIGFSTVVTPTESAILKFKEATSQEILAYEYVKTASDVTEKLDSEVLIKNYISRGLWRAMIGSSNFALSFITSEWYYKMYLLTENLDLTNIVVGYLKSIEQLLYEIIKLSKGEGISIRTKKGIKEFNAETESIADTTLNSLENVIKFNNDTLLEVNEYAKNHLLKIIDSWREKHRNGYFHKHNLQSIETVKEIRETAYYLYFLILGSFKIEESRYAELGIK